MDAFWIQLSLVAGLVLINAAFAGSELALVTLSDSRLQRLTQRSRSGTALARLTRDPNQYLATIQIGITLAGFLASATAAVTLAEPLVEALGALGAAARPVAILCVTVVLTFVTLVVGELAPKRVAMQRAESWALVAARPLWMLAILARPAIWLLSHATDAVVRLLGGDPAQQRADVSEEELRDIVAVQPELTEQERAIVTSAFELADRSLRQVVTPRHEVVALPGDMATEEGAGRLIETGHSRAPVYGRDIDEVVGVVHLRDLVSGGGTVADHARPPAVLPEAAKALEALRSLQVQRQQMAIVIDEHGATEGIVTIEDLVEELIGEIWDEADADVQNVVHEPDGSLTVLGSYPVHDLDEIGVDLPEGEYSTIAGMILDRLGHIPEQGERLEVNGWSLEVRQASPRAILRVRLARVRDDPNPLP